MKMKKKEKKRKKFELSASSMCLTPDGTSGGEIVEKGIPVSSRTVIWSAGLREQGRIWKWTLLLPVTCLNITLTRWSIFSMMKTFDANLHHS